MSINFNYFNLKHVSELFMLIAHVKNYVILKVIFILNHLLIKRD